jgi:hypothetical protein
MLGGGRFGDFALALNPLGGILNAIAGGSGGPMAGMLGAQGKTERMEGTRPKWQEYFSLRDRDVLLEQQQADQLVAKQLKILDTKKQQAAVGLAGAKAELQEVQKKADVQKRMIDTLKQQTMTAREQFAMMSPERQQRILGIAGKARRGERMTREEEQEIQFLDVVPSIAAGRQKSWMERSKEAGWGQLAGQEMQGIIGPQEALQKKLEVEIATRQVNVTVIQKNYQQLVDKIADIVKKRDAEQMQRIEERLKTEREDIFVTMSSILKAVRN